MPVSVKITAEPLANELARRNVLPAPLAVEIVRQLAHEIAQRQESGWLHLCVAADMVSYESDSGRAELREPSEAARAFGGSDCDDEFCPPELQQPRSVLLPVQLAAARDALRSSDLSAVDPRRVDVYQLGALLCRLLTGESVSAFLSRPRVAAKVPVEVRDIIERALGHDPQRALRSATELLRGLETLDAAVTVALPSVQPGSTRNVTEPDTTPSFVGVGKADTDAGRPAPSPTNEEALPFRKLGHYEIVGRLGRGGMGDVYKGYERRLDRHVAIKVLPQEFSRQDEMVRRFNAEASAAAKLVHPNTVEIFFIGEDSAPAIEGQTPSTVHFFAMQFVEGESLAELLARRKRLNVDEALGITEQVLAGLDAAHQLGMVHRDIKPGNILIDRQRQRVQLADFGLVKSLQGSGMTASGVIVGTADYMAPEQGRGGAVDVRADLYAIGVVLYQMLSGRLPFQADSVTAMIFQHVYETPPPLREIVAEIPEPLAAIVAKLMAKPPEARYQNVTELLADLRAFHQQQLLPSGVDRIGVPVSTGTRRASQPHEVADVDPAARPRTVIIPAPRFGDGPALPATLTQMVIPNQWEQWRQSVRDFLLLQTAEFVQQVQTTEQHVDLAIADYEQRHAALLAAIKDAQAVIRDLEAQQEVWRRANAEAEQRANDATDDDVARAALGEKLRGERTLAELAEQLQLQQTHLEEMDRKRAHVTATLERLRSQRDVLNARLKVARVQIRMSGGKASARRAEHWIHRLRWPNVSLLALVFVVLIGVTTILFKVAVQSVRDELGLTGIEKPPLPVVVEEKFAGANTLADLFLKSPNMFGQPFSGGGDGQKQIFSLAVSPTGKHVATASGERTAFIWDAESGKLLHRLSGDLREIYSVAFNHDGTALLTGQSTGEMPLKAWNVSTGELIGGPPTFRDSFSTISASPANSFFVTNNAGEVKIWNSETREVSWSIKTKPDVGRFAFNSDGTLLAAIGTGVGSGEVFVWDVKEKKLLTSWLVSSGPQSVRIGPLFLPGGSELLTSNGADAIARWDARTGKLLSQTPSGLPANASWPVISPDGRWLAASNNSWITIVDARSGFVRAVMSGHQTTALAFTPQSDKLISAGGPPFLVSWDIKSLPVLTGKGWSREIASNPPNTFAWQKPLCLLSVGSQLGVWNYETQSPLLQLKTDTPLSAGISAAAFSPDDLRVAVLESGGRVRVWDVLSGKPTVSTRISDLVSLSPTPQLKFTQDGNAVWVSTAARIWRVDLRKSSAEPWLDWPADTKVTSLSPRGRFAVAASYQVRSTAIGAARWQAWDIAARRPLIPDDKSGYLYESFAFTRDEQRLLALNNQGEFHHWKLESSELVDRFQIRRQDVAPYKLEFLPDQRHVVAYWHPTMRVIDVERREEVLNFQSPTTLTNSEATAAANRRTQDFLQVTHDGHFAVTVGPSDERLHFWNLYPQQKLGK